MSGDNLEFDDAAHVGRLTGTLHDPAATPGDVLTVQADKSIAAQPGGGSTPVQRVTRTITSAELLDISANPIELVTAVAGEVVVPVIWGLSYVFNTTPYDNSGHSVFLGLSSGTGDWVGWQTVEGDGFLDQSASLVFVGFAQTPIAFGAIGGLSTPAGPAPASDWLTRGGNLYLTDDGTASPTGGDGELLVDVCYVTVSIPT